MTERTRIELKGLDYLGEKYTNCEHKKNNELACDCMACDFAWCIERIRFLESRHFSKPTGINDKKLGKIIMFIRQNMFLPENDKREQLRQIILAKED